MAKLPVTGGGHPLPQPPLCSIESSCNNVKICLNIAPDCTILNKKMQKLPAVGGGVALPHPPPGIAPSGVLLDLHIWTVSVLRRALNFFHMQWQEKNLESTPNSTALPSRGVCEA